MSEKKLKKTLVSQALLHHPQLKYAHQRLLLVLKSMLRTDKLSTLRKATLRRRAKIDKEDLLPILDSLYREGLIKYAQPKDLRNVDIWLDGELACEFPKGGKKKAVAVPRAILDERVFRLLTKAQLHLMTLLQSWCRRLYPVSTTRLPVHIAPLAKHMHGARETNGKGCSKQYVHKLIQTNKYVSRQPTPCEATGKMADLFTLHWDKLIADIQALPTAKEENAKHATDTSEHKNGNPVRQTLETAARASLDPVPMVSVPGDDGEEEPEDEAILPGMSRVSEVQGSADDRSCGNDASGGADNVGRASAATGRGHAEGTGGSNDLHEAEEIGVGEGEEEQAEAPEEGVGAGEPGVPGGNPPADPSELADADRDGNDLYFPPCPVELQVVRRVGKPRPPTMDEDAIPLYPAVTKHLAVKLRDELERCGYEGVQAVLPHIKEGMCPRQCRTIEALFHLPELRLREVKESEEAITKALRERDEQDKRKRELEAKRREEQRRNDESVRQALRSIPDDSWEVRQWKRGQHASV